MNIINKKSLAEVVANELDITKKAAAVAVDAVFNEIATTLENGGKVEISGFGKFEVHDKRSRLGRNPHTRQPMMLPARRVATFRLSNKFRNELNAAPGGLPGKSGLK